MRELQVEKPAPFRAGFFVTLLLSVLLTGCENHSARTTLTTAESLLTDQPEEALARLQALDSTDLNTAKLRADFALLHAMALDKSWIDTTDVEVVMPAVRYYDRRKPVSRRAKPHYYLGRIQYNARHYDEAIISFTRAKEYAANLDDNRFKALINQAISDTYNGTYLYEEALPYSEEAYRYGLLAKDTLLANASLYRIAQLHKNLNNLHEADSIYKALLQVESLNPQTKAAMLADYALLSIAYKDDANRALELFELSLSQGKVFYNYNHLGAYAYCLYRTGQIQKSEHIFQLMERAGLKDQYVYQIWKSRIERLNNDYRTAYELLEKSSQEQTEGVMKLLRQSTVKAQRDFFSLQSEALQKENSLRRWLNFLSVLLFITAATIVWIILRQYRERIRRQNHSLMEAVQDLMNLQQINDSNEKTIRQLTIDSDVERQRIKQDFFHLSQENFKELSDLCTTYYKTEGRSTQANVVCGEVRGYLKRIGIEGDRYPSLEQRVNDLFDHAMEHFRTEHPKHREQYYQIVCFLFAGFKIRTIALLLHLDEQAIYQTKWRLKKEVETNPTPHQDDFLALLKETS